MVSRYQKNTMFKIWFLYFFGVAITSSYMYVNHMMINNYLHVWMRQLRSNTAETFHITLQCLTVDLIHTFSCRHFILHNQVVTCFYEAALFSCIGHSSFLYLLCFYNAATKQQNNNIKKILIIISQHYHCWENSGTTTKIYRILRSSGHLVTQDI